MSRWYCETCDKYMSPYGVASHRAMHRRRAEGPVVMSTSQYRITYGVFE